MSRTRSLPTITLRKALNPLCIFQKSLNRIFSSSATTMPSNMKATTPGPSTFVLKPKYADFKNAQASRPPFNYSLTINTTQPPFPAWTYSSGASSPDPSSSSAHIEIDPSAPGRAMTSNYRLLISGVPRPISFINTVSKDGIKNLAPFGYFQVVDHDPPIFVVEFGARAGRVKDTRRNLKETGERVINLASENIVEPINATSLDVPFEVSEWPLSGLTPLPSSTVMPEGVKEALFSIEGSY